MHRSTQLRARQFAALTLAGTLALGALAGCGASSSSDSGGSAAYAPEMSRDGNLSVSSDMAGSAGSDMAMPDISAQGSRAATTSTPMLVRRADTSLVVEDVTAAAVQIRGIAAAAGGSILNESIQGGPATDVERRSGNITIQVPADRLDDTLTQLESIGEMATRNTSADDVSAQYVDVESRVTSLRASVDRMRTLLSEATAIADIISIESELSRRTADLEAMEGQLKYLKDQVAMSPISITLTTNKVDLGFEGGGFLGGLKAGWVAFVASMNFLLMALGAILPFAIAAAIVIVPLVMWLRRRAAAAQADRAAQPQTHYPAQAQPHPATTPAPAAQPTPEPQSTPAPKSPDAG